MMRGFLGSALRRATPVAEPEDMAGPVAASTPAPAAPASPVTPKGPEERSYLGGLIRYQPNGLSPAERMALFGATLSDVGASLRGGEGGSIARTQAGIQGAKDKAAKDAVTARVMSMAKELYPDDEEAQFLFQADPSAFIEQRLKDREPEKPVLVNTRLGPRLHHPKSGRYEVLEDIPDKLPFGWIRDEDTGEISIDPRFVEGQGKIATVRRRAVVENPTPSRARGGGGGSRPAPAEAGVPPWKRTW